MTSALTAMPADLRGDNPFRLPTTIVPRDYFLTLRPDLTAATFTGTVRIECEASAATGQVVLNAAELEIFDATVNGVGIGPKMDGDTERVALDVAVGAGPVTIEIRFSGTLNDKLRGWYRSTFVDATGSTKVIATTQMQATDCRRAFPCFDEPDFKARFHLTLEIDDGLFAVSNGPEIERSTIGDGRVAVRFEPTIPMSSYLVAFVVGPLEATEPLMVPRRGGGDPIPLRIIHVPGKGALTEFGMAVGEHSLRWYQEYYGIPYPAAKCDMLALPDFAAGAMENLGCITYRENMLLADPTTATQVELQIIADVVTHEMAHMWFGDLVTMSWWNGIWLNEAFATFMEIACTDAFKPDWKRWTTFSLERSMAFETDSLNSTRAVEYPVEAPADCDGMFDVLTYQKGGSLLRMLEQYLGEDVFRAGVSHYLATHALGNTETGDLWDAIEHVADNTPVRALMDSWIWQPGYPLVTARAVDAMLHLTQQRFGYTEVADPTTFVVPLVVTIDGEVHKVLLDDVTVSVPMSSAESTVVVNAGGWGFVRVAYDDTLRARLTGPALAHMTVIDRYNLVDDAWNAVVAGRLTAASYLDLIDGFVDEEDLAVWQAIAVGTRGVLRLVDGDALVAAQRRIANLVRPALWRLGWDTSESDDDLTAKLRGHLVSMLAVQGDDTEAQQRCRVLLDTPDADPELIVAAISAVAANGTDADYDEYVKRFRTGVTPQDQLRYLYALADFPTVDQLRRTIDLAFSDEVKTQNAPFLLGRCINNRHTGVAAWESVRRQWKLATGRFPDNTIVRMIDPVKSLTAPEIVSDVQSFFAEHPIPQAAKTLDQVLERQRVNAALAERESARLAAVLTVGDV